MELRGTGVKSSSVNPGPVKTEWQEVAGYDGRRRLTPGMISAEQCVRTPSAPTTATSAR